MASMKFRLVAVALMLLCIQSSLLAQNLPMMGVPRLGKLVPGDTLSVTVFRQPEYLNGRMDLRLRVGVLDDGTISLPLLGKVPAAGLTISDLNTALQESYKTYFNNPPPASGLPLGATMGTPPHVTVLFVGHLGNKTALDDLIERLGK
jgi:protein involved in polysaccharide export with SLBB domain